MMPHRDMKAGDPEPWRALLHHTVHRREGRIFFIAKTQFTAEKGGIVLAQSRSSPQSKEELFQRKAAIHQKEGRNCFTTEKGEFVSTQSRNASQRKEELF